MKKVNLNDTFEVGDAILFNPNDSNDIIKGVVGCKSSDRIYFFHNDRKYAGSLPPLSDYQSLIKSFGCEYSWANIVEGTERIINGERIYNCPDSSNIRRIYSNPNVSQLKIKYDKHRK